MRKIIKDGFLAITILAIISLGVILIPQYLNSFWNNLNDKIENGQESVMVSELTDFDWDIVCGVPPYTLSIGNNVDAKIKELVPYNLGKFKDSIPVYNGDGRFVFIFIKNGTVVEIEERGRGFDVYIGYKDNCIDKADAVLEKHETLKEHVVFYNKRKGIER